jgi:hypothetical protein
MPTRPGTAARVMGRFPYYRSLARGRLPTHEAVRRRSGLTWILIDRTDELIE